MIALTSVTFRSMSVNEVIETALAAGIGAIEWGGDVHVPAGDTLLAEKVGKLCKERGVKVMSYGSYFGLLSGMDFAPWLDSALALGTKDIRIWAGNFKAMRKDYSKDDMKDAVAELTQVCRRASSSNVTVHLEKHRGTLTQSPEKAVELIDGTGEVNLRSYWQPNPEISCDSNLEAIRMLKHRISKVHVFYWNSLNARLPLSDGERDWKNYLSALGQRDFIFEFVRGDSPEQLYRDARTLENWISQGET